MKVDIGNDVEIRMDESGTLTIPLSFIDLKPKAWQSDILSGRITIIHGKDEVVVKIEPNTKRAARKIRVQKVAPPADGSRRRALGF